MGHLQIQFIPGSVLLFIPDMHSILLVNICNEAHLFPGEWQEIIIGATEGESRGCTSLP
jgi:hypothetical protein